MVALNVFREHLKRFNLKCGKSSILLSKFLYRTIPVFSVLALLCCMIVPAQADTLEPAMKTANLLDGGVFDFYADNQFVGSYTSSLIEYSFTEAEWRWQHDTSVAYDKLVVIIQGALPSSLYWKQSSRFPLTYEGSFGNDYHMYATYGYDYDSVSTCSVIGVYSSSASRTFNLVSCFGYLSNNEQITTFDEGRTTLLDDGFYGNISWAYNVRFPRYFGNEGYSRVTEGVYYINIQPDDRDIEFGNAVSFLIRFAGSTIDFTASLIKSGSINTPLNVSSVQSLGTTFARDDDIVYEWYIVTVDISGHDLVGNTIQLQTRVTEKYGFWQVSAQDCYISTDIDVTPNFWGKLFKSINDLGDAIGAAAHNIITSLGQSFDNSINGLSGDIGGFFRTLRTALTDSINQVKNSVDSLHGVIAEYFNQLFSRLDVRQDVGDAIGSGSVSVNQGVGQIQDFESNYQNDITDTMSDINFDSYFNFGAYANSLTFVSTYLTRSFMALGDATILWYLPILLGIILFICTRTPGNTFSRNNSNSKNNFAKGSRSSGKIVDKDSMR